MRPLRYVALLLVVMATATFAAEPGPSNSPARSALTRDANGNFQFRILESAPARQFFAPGPASQSSAQGRELVRDGANEGLNAFPRDRVCYFIRNYIMKREGERGATHLDRVETCTPLSRIHTKKTVRIVPAYNR